MKTKFRRNIIGINTIIEKELFYLIIALIITVVIRLPFLPSNIGFNNDAPVYSDNIVKGFFSGAYNVQVPGYVSYIYLARVLNIFII